MPGSKDLNAIDKHVGARTSSSQRGAPERTNKQAKLYFSIPLSFDARVAHVGLWHHKSERRGPISSRR